MLQAAIGGHMPDVSASCDPLRCTETPALKMKACGVLKIPSILGCDSPRAAESQTFTAPALHAFLSDLPLLVPSQSPLSDENDGFRILAVWFLFSFCLHIK